MLTIAIFHVDRAGAEVACFNNHSRPVTHFLQVPDDVNSRVKRSVISIAEDHSIAIISIEEMSWCESNARYLTVFICSEINTNTFTLSLP